MDLHSLEKLIARETLSLARAEMRTIDAERQHARSIMRPLPTDKMREIDRKVSGDVTTVREFWSNGSVIIRRISQGEEMLEYDNRLCCPGKAVSTFYAITEC